MAEGRPKRERKPSKVFDPEDRISTPKQRQPRKRIKKEPFAFEQLPQHVRLRIVSFLSAGGLCSSATVSKDFKTLAEDNSIWGKQILERFGHFFEEEEAAESDEAIVTNWPAKKPFKTIYRELVSLETQKQSNWAHWGAPKDKAREQFAGSEINGTCPLCNGSLFIEKNDATKKEEEDEIPPSEFVVECKTSKCGFVLPYSKCVSCKQPCNMMNTLVCPGDNCEKKPVAERIHCWDCGKQCESGEKEACLGHMCNGCVLTVKTKRGTAHGCPVCSFSCKGCNHWFFLESERWMCRKCKTAQCNHCSQKGCFDCGYKSDKEDEDEEFGGGSDDDEDDYDEAESD